MQKVILISSAETVLILQTAHLDLALSPVRSRRQLKPDVYNLILKELQYLRPAWNLCSHRSTFTVNPRNGAPLLSMDTTAFFPEYATIQGRRYYPSIRGSVRASSLIEIKLRNNTIAVAELEDIIRFEQSGACEAFTWVLVRQLRPYEDAYPPPWSDLCVMLSVSGSFSCHPLVQTWRYGSGMLKRHWAVSRC